MILGKGSISISQLIFYFPNNLILNIILSPEFKHLFGLLASF